MCAMRHAKTVLRVTSGQATGTWPPVPSAWTNDGTFERHTSARPTTSAWKPRIPPAVARLTTLGDEAFSKEQFECAVSRYSEAIST